MRVRHPDGTYRWQDVRFTNLCHDPSVEGIVVNFHDITERKRAEDALQEARDTLYRVTRLTTMGELSASIAHEINQPLSAIVANGAACLNLLSEPTPDVEEAKEAIADIISDGRRASAVLARVRQLVKKSVPERARVDINDALTEVLSLARQELQRS